MGSAMNHQSTKPSRASASTSGLPGCTVSLVRDRLRAAGLRPTRQRMMLGWLLFGQGDRHVTAEQLYEESTRAGTYLSLATVYNTLRQFSDASLIRPVPTAGGKSYFDTNASAHQHFLVEDTGEMIDIDDAAFQLVHEPAAPDGYEIAGVDVVVRLRKIAR